MSTRQYMRLIRSILACVLVGYMLYAGIPEVTKKPQTTPPVDPDTLHLVASVLDGDTIKVSVASHDITVRLLGIDTPETVDPRKPVQCFGADASQATKELLKGRQVRLVFNPDREMTDKYGRYLAYVYRDDGLLVNEELIREGFAREYTYGKAYSLQKDFRSTEREARADNRGLWGECE